MRTRPEAARPMAARRPATPPPTMRKSTGCTRMLSYHPHPMDPVRIDVSTPSRAYSVTIGEGLLDRVGGLLAAAGAPARRFVVSSPLVWRLHGPQLARAATLAAPSLVPDGERFKQLSTLSPIYNALARP